MAFANPTDFEVMDEPESVRSRAPWANPDEFEEMASPTAVASPDSTSPPESEQNISQDQLTAARDAQGRLDPRKIKLTPQQRQQALEESGLGDLARATSPAQLSKLGADYSVNPVTRVAQQEVMEPGEVVPSMFMTVPEGVKGILPRPTRYRSDVETPIYSTIAGATEGAENFAESNVTGLNILLGAGMGGAPGVVKRAAQLGFAGQMASQLPELKQNIENAETPREKAKAWSDLILAGGMTFAAGKEGFAGEAAPRRPFYTVAPSQEMLNRATTRNQQRMLAPETKDASAPNPVGSPEILDGLHIARKRLLGNFSSQPPEVQRARQAEIDHIDGVLLDHDRNAVNESATRVAEQGPPKEPAGPAAPIETGGQSGSPRIENVATPSTAQPKAEALRASQAAATEPLKQVAAEAQQDLPAASQAAKELAAAVEQKVSSPQPDGKPEQVRMNGVDAHDFQEWARGKTVRELRKLRDEHEQDSGSKSDHAIELINEVIAEKSKSLKATFGPEISSPQPKVEALPEPEPPIAEQERVPAEEVPPTTETAAVEPPAEAAPVAGPALRVPGETEPAAKGQMGQKHADLVGKALSGLPEDQLSRVTNSTTSPTGFEHVFHDENGNVLTREEAAQRALDKGQISQEQFDAAMARTGEGNRGLHSEDLIEVQQKTPDEVSTPASEEKPSAVERPVATPDQPVERSGAEETTAAPATKKSLLDQLDELLAEEEKPKAAETSTEPEKSDAQKRVDAIRQDIENNKDADIAWKNRRRKDLKAAEKALQAEQESAPAEEAPVEEAAKETWQKTRGEIEKEGGSLAKHRNAVREAVSQGKDVPLATLEDYTGSAWADKMREQKYGQEISDTLFDRILDALKDDQGNLYFDPTFIKSIGKPALRGAVRLIREGFEAGKLAKDVMTDVVNYIKSQTDTFDETKTREFFQPIVDEASGGKGESAATEPVKAEPQATPEGEKPQRLTSTKNAVVDAERKARGEPELMSEAKQSLGDTWEAAMRKLDIDPNEGQKLVGEIRSKPRAINAVEEALLLHHKVDVMNELAKSTELAMDEKADAGERLTARVRSSELMDELNDIDEATRKAGTEWGRTGRFRQMLAAEDYSLVRMIQKSEMAKGRKLTEEEVAKVKKMSDRITELEKQLADHEKNREADREKIRNEELDKFIAEKQGISTPVLKVARRIVEKWKTEADEARANLKNLFGSESGAVGGVGGGKGGRKLGQQDVEQSRIAAVAKIMRAHIAEVGLDFAEAAARVVSEFGEKVRPYLDRSWEMANRLVDGEKGAAAAIKQAVKKKVTDPEEQRKNIVTSIKARADAKESVGKWVQKLAESFVRDGVTDRNALVDAVHKAVKDALPEASPRDIRDAISGYGDYKELSQDQVKVKLRDLKGQMQQVSKLEDMLEKGELPKKTGVQRREPSAEERQLLKEVNKVKKELGLGNTDPERLKGALDAAKTRARNRIEDLQRAIEKGEKIPKSEKALVEDEELKDLKTQRDALQKEYDAAFGKPRPTEDQIAADKAQKAVDRAAAALDRQQRINSGEIKPEPNEKVEPLSQLEQELRDRTEELRDAKRKADAYKSPETVAAEKAQKGVDAAAAAVDRWDQILKGELERTPGTEKESLSNLEEELRSQADAMRQAADELRHQPKSEDAKQKAREEAQIKALEKSLKEYERKIKEMDFSSKGKTQSRPEVERVAKAREARDAVKKVYDDLKDAQTPKKTPEEIALAAYKSRTQSRINELNERLKTRDFSKKARREIKLDAEGQKLKTEAERVKLEFDKANYKEKMKNRSWAEKWLDNIPKYERAFLLSNPITFAKLFMAAVWRTASTPLENLVGSGLGKLPFVSEIASRAPYEGRFNSKAEAKALTAMFTKGMKDAAEKGRTGESQLDSIWGKKNVAQHEWIDFFGNLHGAVKAPVVRAAFARAYEQGAEFYARHGLDITDPMVEARIGIEAYKEAKKAIFQQDNRVVQIYNTALRQLEQPSKITGRPSLGNKVIQATAKTLFPIVKIPTNIVAEALQYATGTITGSTRMAMAFRRGVETLKPEEADLIMRELKKGSLGGAVMLLGYLAPQVIGGFYQHGMKRRDDDVKAGHVKLYGHDIPPFLLHAPLIEMLQVGATTRRVADSKLRNRDTGPQGTTTGVTAAALGLLDEVPFVRDTAALSKMFNPYERENYFGELARSRTEPQLIQWLAQQTDKSVPFSPSEGARQRKPESLGEEMKVGIPGLRQQVPLKEKKRSSFTPSRRTTYKRPWK